MSLFEVWTVSLDCIIEIKYHQRVIYLNEDFLRKTSEVYIISLDLLAGVRTLGVEGSEFLVQNYA